MIKIGVDLRCLNYPKYTGINTYCIHILDAIYTIKKSTNTSEMEIIPIGLDEARYQSLIVEFGWLELLFGIRSIVSQPNQIRFGGKKIAQLVTLLRIIVRNDSLNNIKLPELDYLIQPQPRPIELNPKTKLLTFFHDVYDLSLCHFKLNAILNNRLTWGLIAKRCDRIIVNSRSTGQDLIKVLGVNSDKIKLIYPALPNLDGLRTSQGVTIKENKYPETVPKNYIMAISGIEPRKNWHNLLLAYKLSQEKCGFKPSLILAGTIVDPKYFNYLKKLIRIHSIKNVVWIIEPIDVVRNKLLSGCDFVVYPSFYEGFGFPILEARKYNKSILTSRNSSLVEINNSSIYINPNNFVSISNGIVLMSKDDNLLPIEKYEWKELEISLREMLITCG